MRLQRDCRANREMREAPASLAGARRAGEGSREGSREGERHLGREADRKGGRGLRKAERKKRDEAEPKKAFYFSSLKNKKQTLCFN